VNILLFLLDTIFFALVAAAMLRAWLNAVRIHMGQQPGPFVLALTDWLVMPLRKALPLSMKRSRLDAASLLAAVLLSLVHAGLWFGMVMASGGMAGWAASAVWSAVPALAIKTLLHTALQGLLLLMVAYAVWSWVQPFSAAFGWLNRLLAPLLMPLRRFVPLVGGVDLSALVFVLLLQVGLMLLG
jgi:YggT family protein